MVMFESVQDCFFPSLGAKAWGQKLSSLLGFGVGVVAAALHPNTAFIRGG